jgi:hypothetical protein
MAVNKIQYWRPEVFVGLSRPWRATLDSTPPDTDHRNPHFMSRQYNKIIKRKRRHAYLKRRTAAKNAAAKAATKS